MTSRYVQFGAANGNNKPPAHIRENGTLYARKAYTQAPQTMARNTDAAKWNGTPVDIPSIS